MRRILGRSSPKIADQDAWAEGMRLGKNRLLHIHIPKTGGTSIRKALFPSLSRTRHLTAARFSTAVWESSFTFAVVRNPFARTLSQYVFHCRGKYTGTLLRQEPELRRMSFLQYLRAFVVPQQRTMFLPQVDFVTHPDSSRPIQFLCRQERLGDDFSELLRRLDLPECRLAVRNRSKHQHYSSYYDAQAVRIVRQVYRKDFDAFGYSFEE